MIDRKKLERLVWRHTHRDYRGTLPSGDKSILHLESGPGQSGATVLAPLSTLTESQLLAKLPSAARAELESK